MQVKLKLSSSLAVALLFSAISGTISCRSQPQGYWTRPDRAQALTNQEYPEDSKDCQAIAASNGAGRARDYQARLFTQCMQAKGYQWLVEPRVSRPKDVSLRSAPSPVECSDGRLITDAFGYPKCVPPGGKDGEILQDVSPRRYPPMEQETPLPMHVIQPADGRSKDDVICRQYAKESLSGTYGVYSQCMMEKGWDSKP